MCSGQEPQGPGKGTEHSFWLWLTDDLIHTDCDHMKYRWYQMPHISVERQFGSRLLRLEPCKMWFWILESTYCQLQFGHRKQWTELSVVAQSCPTFATPWTAASQAPWSMGFSRQEYWIGLPFPSPEYAPRHNREPGTRECVSENLGFSRFSLFHRLSVLISAGCQLFWEI